jgi:hypothetical protein
MNTTGVRGSRIKEILIWILGAAAIIFGGTSTLWMLGMIHEWLIPGAAWRCWLTHPDEAPDLAGQRTRGVARRT